MRGSGFTQIDVVKREDKEAKLAEFITTFVNQCGGVSRERNLLVARSALSPVTRALITAFAAGQLTGPVRVIFAMADAAAGSGSDRARLPASTDGRVAKNVRLHEAHEQLVLGDKTSWFGDCMRREPEKCDAWECFALDDAEQARRAGMAFERLWAGAEPMVRQGSYLPAPAKSALRQDPTTAVD